MLRWTHAGLQAIQTAELSGTKVKATHIAIGDGGGQMPDHSGSTMLVNELYRLPIDTIRIVDDSDATSGKVVEYEVSISENKPETGSWMIREVAILAGSTVIGIGQHPELEKVGKDSPKGTMTHTITAPLVVSNEAVISLWVDPAVHVTKAELDSFVKQFVRHDAEGNVEISGNVSISDKYLTPWSSKNLIINGCMRIWQRGTAFTGAGGQYGSVDRWKLTGSGYLEQSTVTPAGGKYSIDTDVGAEQVIENPTFGGQMVTLSVWIQTHSTITLHIGSITKDHTGSGEWERILLSATAPPGDISVKIIGACKFSMAQLERGSVATEFETRSIVIEQLMCQRYYQTHRVMTMTDNDPTNSKLMAITPPSFFPMRAIPTVSHEPFKHINSPTTASGSFSAKSHNSLGMFTILDPLQNGYVYSTLALLDAEM